MSNPRSGARVIVFTRPGECYIGICRRDCVADWTGLIWKRRKLTTREYSSDRGVRSIFKGIAVGYLEKFLSPSRHESDSVTARGHGRMERAGHGAEGLFRC